jgi:hypothetical protein
MYQKPKFLNPKHCPLPKAVEAVVVPTLTTLAAADEWLDDAELAGAIHSDVSTAATVDVPASSELDASSSLSPMPRGEVFVEEEVSRALKTLQKETKLAEKNNLTMSLVRIAELEAEAAADPGWEERRDGEGDDLLTATGRAKFYAALASESKRILLGTSVTGHRPQSMLQASPATNPALRASNPVVRMLQQAGGGESGQKPPLQRCALVGNSQQQLMDPIYTLFTPYLHTIYTLFTPHFSGG